MGKTMLVVLALSAPAVSAVVPEAGQIPFEQAERDLASTDARTRLHTVQMLKEAAYPQAAVPLAALIGDPQDEVQFEAIAAELNIFAADKVVPRKRVGLVIEVRTPLLAEAMFSSGPLAIGPLPVPAEVLNALRTGVRDDNPRVGLESLYAFGALAVEPHGAARHEMLRVSGPDLAALIGASDTAMRYAALRVLGRVFARRADDDPIDPIVGDAVIAGLNDRDHAVNHVAIEALGAMRYERGVQSLTDLFQHYGKGAVAEAALDALARIAYPGSAPLFTAQLTAKSAALRGIAVEGLARIGDGARLADIQTALANERDVAVSLAEAFATIMLSNGQVDRITETLMKPKLRNQAKQYLIEIAPGRTSLLSRQLQDPEPRIRLDVVDALGLAGDPAALPMLEPLKNDRDPLVARAAEGAVARLQKH